MRAVRGNRQGGGGLLPQWGSPVWLRFVILLLLFKKDIFLVTLPATVNETKTLPIAARLNSAASLEANLCHELIIIIITALCQTTGCLSRVTEIK